MIRNLVARIRSHYLATQKAHYVAAMLARTEVERLKALHPEKLTAFGFQAFSQNEEDGMLQEVFRRIGVASKTFIEIGAGEGVENNSVYLLLTGWSGLWLEADRGSIQLCRSRHHLAIRRGQLVVQESAVTAENVNQLLAGQSDPDLLSLDIDGNDYWVWKALKTINPRVVLVEYNATFRPPAKVAQRYNPSAIWNGTNYYGASLSALEELGTAKGYVLIGCDLSGNNAFFVRKDCMQSASFPGPFTAEAQYLPPRYDLFALQKERDRFIWNAHPPGFGEYLNDLGDGNTQQPH